MNEPVRPRWREGWGWYWEPGMYGLWFVRTTEVRPDGTTQRCSAFVRIIIDFFERLFR